MVYSAKKKIEMVHFRQFHPLIVHGFFFKNGPENDYKFYGAI